MKLFLACLLLISCPIFAEDPLLSEKSSYLECSPELSYGVHDNGPAWVEMVPFRGGVFFGSDTSLKGGLSYAYEIDREKKPFGDPNHYGWRVSAKFEHSFLPNGDARFFYDVNIGSKAEGTHNQINYLQMTNYQRVGIIWRLFKIM